MKEKDSVWRRLSKLTERVMNALFFLCGMTAIVFVLLITLYLAAAGIPAIREIGLIDFLFGPEWKSTAAAPSFGILPLILTSVYGTAGAVLLGVPAGVLCAVYLAKFAHRRAARFLRSLVDLLAGVPSVVYGLLGIIVLVPFIADVFRLASGASLLCAMLVLTVMILPSIISISETALRAVPQEYEEASLALGATYPETVFKVTLPAAKSGVAAGIVLGVGRAIGEAMAVMMVAGNIPNMPGLFKSVSFLTTVIAQEMSYSGGLQRQALFSIALVLFVFIMAINFLLHAVLKKGEKR